MSWEPNHQLWLGFYSEQQKQDNCELGVEMEQLISLTFVMADTVLGESCRLPFGMAIRTGGLEHSVLHTEGCLLLGAFAVLFTPGMTNICPSSSVISRIRCLVCKVTSLV